MMNNLDTSDDWEREFAKRTGEGAYCSKYGRNPEEAVRYMMKHEGKTLSAAKKSVQKEVRRLAEEEKAAQQQQVLPIGRAIIDMQRARDGGELS